MEKLNNKIKMKGDYLKMRKNEKGITLVALVITIIVLLILAGVTINLTLGENGIFRTAEQAARNYKDAEEKELGLLSEFEASVTAGKVARVENGVQYVGDGVGNLIPVPVGFSYLEGTKNTGFVIKNDTDDNEFVWVPVTGMGYTFNRYAFLEKQPEWELDDTTSSMKIKNQNKEYYFTEKLPEDEEASVNIYGGYYIGRYECGVTDYTDNGTTSTGTTWTRYEGGTLLVQQGKQAWNYITGNRARSEAEELYNKTEDNVTSKLCSSYAWDTALKFIETQNKTYPISSVGGNSKNNTGEIQETGYDLSHPCNIYDMGGNFWEWTTESYSESSTMNSVRGCSYVDNCIAAWRGYRSNAGYAENTGFRVALFL